MPHAIAAVPDFALHLQPLLLILAGPRLLNVCVNNIYPIVSQFDGNPAVDKVALRCPLVPQAECTSHD